jgi:hypothetical protein
MQVLSTSNMKQFNDTEVMARFNQLIPLLDSREKTLAFLAHGLNETSIHGIDGTWEIDVFWAAYYGDYELAEAIMTAGSLADERFGDIHDTSWLDYTILNPIHNSEAYKQMIRSIKLDDFWRENGFPTSCRPLGEDDFACN